MCLVRGRAATGGAVVLQIGDLQRFQFATGLGYAIPSAFLDRDGSGDDDLFVVHGSHDSGLPPATSPCPGLTTGGQFDGYYPSAVSPGAAAGHTKLTGKVFFINGCDTGKRTFTARTFTITAEPGERARRHLKREP